MLIHIQYPYHATWMVSDAQEDIGFLPVTLA